MAWTLTLLSRKQRRAARRRRAWKLGGVLGGGLALVLLVGGGLFLLGSNDAANGPNESATVASNVVAAQPTAHPRSKVGALVEGAIAMPGEAPVPPSSELRANGGARFSLPLAAFAAIDDWFGTPRQYGMTHGGVDFGLEGMGSVPVRAACSGVVSETGPDGPYGPHVTVDCGGNWTTLYAYLGSVNIDGGATVDRTTQIGMSDSADLFLHFEIRWQGIPVDPADYLPLPPRPRPEPTPTPTRASNVPARSGAGGGGAVAPENTTAALPSPGESTSTPEPTAPGSTATTAPTARPTATATRTSTPTPRSARPTPTAPVSSAP